MASPLSQLDATLATDQAPPATGAGSSPRTPRRFSQVRTALIRALRSSPEAREPLCDALEQLEAIQQELEEYRQALPDPAPTLSPLTPPRRRKTNIQEYEIQRTADGGFLTERRAGHSQPFRCPRATYDAAARVLEGAAEALPFEDLMERLNSLTGSRQPDYRLRVALRFWMTHEAVLRSRTKYRAAERAGFERLARQLWDQLEAGTAAAPAAGPAAV
jgi:hypothetical protein